MDLTANYISKVAIIVPAFQCGDKIGCCLNSCICQTHTDIEIIVIAWESDDGTDEIIANYQALDARICVIKRKRGLLCRGLNRDMLHSDYVLFVDPSDELSLDCVEKLLQENACKEADPEKHFYRNISSDENVAETSGPVAVSCVIPVFQAEQFLKESIDSARGQSLQEIEIICVDDGSSDSSLRILEEEAFFDDRIAIVENSHLGVSPARNTAIRHASGEFIAFLDADDYLPDTQTYERMYAAAKEHQALICGGSFAIVNHKTGKVRYPSSGTESGMTFPESGKTAYRDYQYDFSFTRFLYDREFLIRNQLYFPDRSYFEDPVWFVRVMDRAGSFHAIKDVTYCARIEHKPPTHSVFTDGQIACLLEGLADNLAFAEQKGYDELYRLEMQRLMQDYPIAIAVKANAAEEPRLLSAVERISGVIGMKPQQFRSRLIMRYAEVSDIRWKRRTTELEKRIKSLEVSQTDLIKALEKETQEKKRLAGELEKNQKSTATAAALKELEQRVSGDEELIAQLRENCRQTALLIERQSKEKSPAIQRIGKGFRYIGSWADARRTIILQMRDRLGNQMFIYALYCRLKSMGRNVAIDDASWYLHTPAGKNALKDAFRLEYKTAGADAVRALEDTGEHRFDRLRRKLFGRRSLKYSEQSFQYDPVFLRAKKGYFTGWFQDPRYFQPVAGQVRESFGFDMDALRRSETAGPLYREITEKKHAVSIHLRYGDYLKPDNAAKYGGICSAAYYCAGIRYFRELFPDDRVDYYVFSDDTGKAEEWIRDVFEPLRTDRENAHIVSNEKVTADNLQMALMSACHHHIIANSTFSWWAAFLNPSKEKIIIRPSVWFFENGKSIQPLSTDVPAVTIAPDGEIL